MDQSFRQGGISMANELMTTYIPNVGDAIKQWKAYQQLCGKEGILDESDYQKIRVKEKDPETGKYVVVEREFKKKSAWQKLARAFNVDTKIVSRELQRTKTGSISEAYYCVCATLPNGRSVESDALCSRKEKGKSKVSDHAIMSTAKTRATNRAIGELIGAGEISSDEMTSDYQAVEEPDSQYISTSTVEETPEPKEIDETPEPEDTVQEPLENEPPKLIQDCINALSARGMKITQKLIKICIEDRSQDEKEYQECMKWLENNIKFEEVNE